MKKNNIILVTIVALLFALVSCNGGGTPKLPKMANEVDSMNYAYGLFNGAQMRMMFMMQEGDSIDETVKKFYEGVRDGLAGAPEENPEFTQFGAYIGGMLKQEKDAGLQGDSTLDLNYELVRQGIINGMNGKEDQMSGEEAFKYFENTMRVRYEQKMLKEFGARKEEGDKFLAENKTKEGVKTTASGLQYEVVKEGTGEKPIESDMVKVHYSGKLLDGSVFDSSYERNEPATFAVGQVIRGWIEGLQLMPVGSTYRFYVPQELAYGPYERPGIPPFSVLVFDVELLEIVKQ